MPRLLHCVLNRVYLFDLGIAAEWENQPVDPKGGSIVIESSDIHKAEYEQLNHESRLHQTTASTIVSLEIAALGVGIPAASSYSYVLLALSGITSLLWLRYLDHILGIFRVAAYIALVLRPTLSSIVNEQVLQWEQFLRQFRSGRFRVTKTEGTTYVLQSEKLREPTLGVTYTSALFGVVPPVLIVSFLFLANFPSLGAIMASCIAITSSVALWAFSLLKLKYTSKFIDGINSMLDGTIEVAPSA